MKIRDELRKMVPGFAKKVAPVYSLLKWKWADKGIPMESDIIENANRLITELDLSKDYDRWDSGGISVWFDAANHEYGIGMTIDEPVFYSPIDTIEERACK